MVAVCVAHTRHLPQPTYCELHHVIPQAWQVFWQPPQPWPNGGASPDRAGVALFDARVVPLCRTGHGNVHHWLVETMRALAAAVAAGKPADDLATVAAAWSTVRSGARGAHVSMNQAEVAIANEAMSRWLAAGGSLAALAAHALWGEI